MRRYNTNKAPASAKAIEQKRREFQSLVLEAAACRECPAMCERTAVLSERNGTMSARVMLIGEAPGRQGGDRTRVPFSGDASGRNLQRYLDSIGLNRAEIFFTNAALCNPRTPTGANRTPTGREVANCSSFLRRQIEIIDPRVVVTLGRVSLAALKSIEYHELTLRDTAGKIFEWNERLLVPLYHPSPQVLASHRREEAQLKDYEALAHALMRAEALTSVRKKRESLPIDHERSSREDHDS